MQKSVIQMVNKSSFRASCQSTVTAIVVNLLFIDRGHKATYQLTLADHIIYLLLGAGAKIFIPRKEQF